MSTPLPSEIDYGWYRIVGLEDIGDGLILGWTGKGKNPKKRYPTILRKIDFNPNRNDVWVDKFGYQHLGSVEAWFGHAPLLKLWTRIDTQQSLEMYGIPSLERGKELLINIVKAQLL